MKLRLGIVKTSGAAAAEIRFDNVLVLRE